jgi:integrase
VAEGRSPQQRAAGTLEGAVERFLNVCAKGQKSARNTEWLLRRHILPRHHHDRLADITRADIRELLAGIDRPVLANRVHSVIRRFFNWCVEQDLLTGSPVAGVKTPNKEISRDRVLSDDESRTIWRAANGGPFGAIVKLLLLTGQRRTEVSRMEWSEVDLDTRLWTLPKERTKNGRRHEIPLSSQAATLLESLPRIGDRYVFSVNGKSPFNGFKAKEGFCSDLPNWTLHDLRRTVASGMARLALVLSLSRRF